MFQKEKFSSLKYKKYIINIFLIRYFICYYSRIILRNFSIKHLLSIIQFYSYLSNVKNSCLIGFSSMETDLSEQHKQNKSCISKCRKLSHLVGQMSQKRLEDIFLFFLAKKCNTYVC